MSITQSRVMQEMSYNPDTGEFIRLKSNSNRASVGSIVGTEKSGYLQVRIDGRAYKLHQLAWLYVYGEMPPSYLDHINHNRKDNRILNLRLADKTINAKNRSLNPFNTSGFNGVTYNKRDKGWYAQIMVNQKGINLGFFKDKEKAIQARKEANIKYGFHKNHGLKEVA